MARGSALFQRFARSFGAYGFGQLVNVFSQFALVPLFLGAWGSERYGEWLVLSALPAVILLSDVGFSSTGANRMAQHAAKGETQALRVTLHTLNVFLLAVSVLVLAAVLIGLYAVSVSSAFGIKQYAEAEVRLAVLLLGLNALLSIYSGLLTGIYRAGGRNARGAMAQNLIRLATLLASMALIPFSESIAALAGLMLLIQAIGTLVMLIDSRHDLPGVTLGFRSFETAELKAGLRPALAFMALPLGNAIYFQGLTLLANHYFAANGVVLFNTLRTFSRVIVQVAQLVKHASWPEFSLLLARKGRTAARWFHRLCFEANLVVSLLAALFGLAIGGWLIPAWTHGAVAPETALTAAFMASAFLSCIGMISLGVLQSSNAHESVSWQYLGCYVIGWLVALATGPAWGQYGFALGMAIAEGLILLASLKGAIGYLNEKGSTFGLSVLSLADLLRVIRRRRMPI